MADEIIYEKLKNIEILLGKIYKILLRYEREDASSEIDRIAKELESYQDME